MIRRWMVWSILFLTMFCQVAPTWATSKRYTLPGTVITFGDSGQGYTYTITFNAIGAGAGRVSAIADKGAGAQPSIYYGQCTLQFTGTNVVNEYLELYVALSRDGTRIDGEVGTADASLTTDKRKNLQRVGVLIVDQTTTNTNITASFFAYIPTRYFSFAYWNASSLPLRSSSTVSSCSFYPMPDQMQDT